jgi:hypothetical protein
VRTFQNREIVHLSPRGVIRQRFDSAQSLARQQYIWVGGYRNRSPLVHRVLATPNRAYTTILYVLLFSVTIIRVIFLPYVRLVVATVPFSFVVWANLGHAMPEPSMVVRGQKPTHISFVPIDRRQPSRETVVESRKIKQKNDRHLNI